MSSGRSVFGNIGISQLLILMSFLTFVLLLILLIKLRSRIKLSDKTKARIMKVKEKVFYNPLIRYLLLNALKFNFAAFIVFRKPIGGAWDVFLGLVIMISMTVLPALLFYLLRKNRDNLEQEEQRKVYGTLYTGKNVEMKAENQFIYILVFFYRRTLFVCATIFLYDYPTIQVIVNI